MYLLYYLHGFMHVWMHGFMHDLHLLYQLYVGPGAERRLTTSPVSFSEIL
jgi:hypothetical protein